jgi:hypothetical protein
MVIGTNPRPRYASILRNIMYNKPRIVKLRIIRITNPESLFCHDGLVMLGN